jgi:hypothetical protein
MDGADEMTKLESALGWLVRGCRLMRRWGCSQAELTLAVWLGRFLDLLALATSSGLKIGAELSCTTVFSAASISSSPATNLPQRIDRSVFAFHSNLELRYTHTNVVSSP